MKTVLRWAVAVSVVLLAAWYVWQVNASTNTGGLR